MTSLASACATPPPPSPPVITWEDKLEWMMRLEDARILREPNPAPPVVLVPATKRRPAIVAPPLPTDLVRLMRDPEARVRRRAALAAGRVGLPAAIEPLSALLATDQEFEVRQMAAFALGLIGDPAAQPALLAALQDPNITVQARAAEALGSLDDRTEITANAVSAMVRTHVAGGALQGIAADDLGHPLAPPAEAVRLGLFALVRIGLYEPLAAAALDGSGQPVSTWWPIAYAIQRLGDPKGAAALVTLLGTDGRYTASFAARGLGVMKSTSSAHLLRGVVQERRRDPAVVIEALRALAAMRDVESVPVLTSVISDGTADRTLRLEALTALGTVGGTNVDLLLDLLSESWPPLRAAAMRALVATDPDTFVTALSGLDPDRDWTVRAAQAGALGTLGSEQAQPRLMAMLRDRDQRVVPSVLQALVRIKAAGVEAVLMEHLKAEDFVVRAAAATGLGDIKAASAAPALVEAFTAAQRDNTYVARTAAMGALAKLGSEVARPVLQEALQDRDWAVRVRAAVLMREIGGTEPMEEAIRPAPAERSLTQADWKFAVAPKFSPHAFIDTDRGTIELELAVLDAPMTVTSFMDLARRGFFNGIAIHRVVPDFVVQDGDPRGDGEGGPGYTIRDEINQRPYLRGTVGMALDWPDTGGSQFFITHSPQPHLDARYTVFGHVVSGMDVVDRIEPYDVIQRIRIWDGTTGSAVRDPLAGIGAAAGRSGLAK
jgi:cyclophilin family peptidyl-prolyl cis-trans isomerase/HEAT repeat protein